MRRNEYFDYERRISRFDNDYLYWGLDGDKSAAMKIPWCYELVSADGAQYHCWIPKGLSVEAEKDLRERFKIAARRKGDPVAFSWDYIPDGATVLEDPET